MSSNNTPPDAKTAKSSSPRFFFDLGFFGLLALGAVSTVPQHFFIGIVIFGLLPLIIWPHRIVIGHKDVLINRLVIPFGIYVSYGILALFLFPGLPPDAPRPANPDLELYLVALLLCAIGVLRASQISSISHKMQTYLPWLLIVVFLVLTTVMLSGEQGCRITALTRLPFIPALVFATLSFLTLLGWSDRQPWERVLRLSLLAMSVVVAAGYTGSRGISLAIGIVLLVLALLAILPRFRTGLPSSAAILMALGVGLLGCWITQEVTGCRIFNRLDTAIRPLSEVRDDTSDVAADTPEISDDTSELASDTSDVGGDKLAVARAPRDGSIGLRLEMWRASLDAIRTAPIFGHGSMSQQMIIAERFGLQHPHAHNQYLSWLVTGGLVLLVIGCVFLASPAFLSIGMLSADRVIIGTATTALWGLSMVFDSFLSVGYFLHYFCFLLGVILALSNEARNRIGVDVGQGS